MSVHRGGSATRDSAKPVSGVPKPMQPVMLPAQITVDEPPEPRRIRRPPDLMRLLFETGLIAVVLLLAVPGASTTTGLETDIHNSITLAPQLFLSTITLLTNIATAVIPVGLAIERLYRHEGRRVADGVIAAAIAYLGTSLLNLWIDSNTSPDWLSEVLTRHLASSTTTPLHVYIATVIAFLTIIGFGDRPALQTFTWSCVLTYAVATLINGNSALVGLMVTFLFGRTVAFGWRYARGVVNARPTGYDVVTSLFDAGLEPVACRWIGETEDTRRYEADTHDGRLLDVTVLDRDRQAVGLVYRLYRRIRLRGPAQRRNLLSLRRAVDQEALMSYALRDAGIRTPRLVAVRELSADAAVLAYERVEGRSLEKLTPDELTDELLTRIWQLQQQMQLHQVAHRRFALDSLLVDRDGQVWLLDLRNGEIAASALQTRLDTAELMATLALRYGPERTVRIGAQVLGADAMGAALPMLQPVVLTRTTRTAVRKSKDLLQRIREQILAYQPQATWVAEPVKLERLRPRTLLTVAAGLVAAYLVLYQLASSNLSLSKILATASPWWAMVAVFASVMTYVAAGMVLTGFIPERLPVVRNFLVQVAAGFVSIVAPAAVGGVALNTRYLQKQGIGTGPAVSAVGASQAVGFIMHIALIAAFSFIANTGTGGHSFAPSTVVIAILLAIGVIAMVTIGVKPLRKYAVARLKPFFEGTLPRLLDVAQNPRKLSIGLGGTILLSLMNALCLWASVLTISPHANISYATTAVVFLTAQAIGSVIPVPSGIGTVELAMAGALTSIGGLPALVGTPAVFIFRLLRTYLPVIPGYFAFTHLQRKGAL
ncbi:lysylphosphatidylglycerol synthase transmembrane domain-containing protein [Actinocrinis sp.]|uniref:lysylphosphatidylglycerol synthase transmembrane domain-containing protein n=1 Tax=Actinocrinis sp. TaxID=1920516 RepID=UPI002C2AF08F|nr:lysylphosphatidylglycerol synthase transmembrane domain-containing protein [Actinocrinis sp.]HXR71699.1 lysylphosphatidylglycerol synthase transmembrane domain-containing protein [Actinocrinis sp.]